MSASLVGSEMCIRDRVCAYCIDPAVIESTMEHELLKAVVWSINVICLLYTSDAADQCVDLGGR
eukprot:14098112-Alexandrium_andersonii.AAC.1